MLFCIQLNWEVGSLNEIFKHGELWSEKKHGHILECVCFVNNNLTS